jgi:hypothetical protein
MDIIKQFTQINTSLTDINNWVPKMNQNQLLDLLSNIYGQILWTTKCDSCNPVSLMKVSKLQTLAVHFLTILNSQSIPLQINTNGVRIDRKFTELSAEHYGKLLTDTGNWSLFLYIDSFHCYWINQSSLKIICYCEGDVITRSALNNDMLEAELISISQWHKENKFL